MFTFVALNKRCLLYRYRVTLFAIIWVMCMYVARNESPGSPTLYVCQKYSFKDLKVPPLTQKRDFRVSNCFHWLEIDLKRPKTAFIDQEYDFLDSKLLSLMIDQK